MKSTFAAKRMLYAVVNRSGWNFEASAYWRWAQFVDRDDAVEYLRRVKKQSGFDLVLVRITKKC